MTSARVSAPVLNGLSRDDAEESTIYSSVQQSSDNMQKAEVSGRQDTDKSGDNSSIQTQVEPWRLTEEVKDFELNSQAGGRRLGVTWKDLSVKVVPSDERLKENIISQFNLLQLLQDFRQKPALKTILESSTGCVRPGEMLLVLGRPGSGCTTLLKMLANKRKGYVHFS
jgi:ATP-binding cassette subfamily G (WHITE) protein 2 (SNQ2)